MPPMFTSGNGLRTRMPARSPTAATVPLACQYHSLLLRGTPLGLASVPEVQQIVTTSSALRRIDAA
jgi:hypothetical protein